MEIIADAHIHIYPVHDATTLITGARERLMRYAATARPALALCLTEAQGFDAFCELRESKNIDMTPESGAILFHRGDEQAWIFAGRQIVARERIEILALLCEEKIPDGLAVREIISRVLEAGGVPVLAWAPGKWMFNRAEVVQRLLEDAGPEKLLLGDSSLRPQGWPEPEVMKTRRTLAGSDPLPFAGEEEQAGRYGIRMQLDFDEKRPVACLRAALLSPQMQVERIGSRNTPWSMIRRMVKHRQQKRITR